MKGWYAKNPEKHRDIRRRGYIKNKEKIIEVTSAYIKNHPEIRAKGQNNYRAKYPQKYKAHGIISDGVRSGRIKKEPCRVCGETKRVHAHHSDYSKPRDIMWLCQPHHKAWHRVFIAENP